ncbi:MAG: response regulator [Treponema sp.]|nr:response regulator [Treponema sp.]
MAEQELYVMGDTNRLVVKAFLAELEKKEFTVHTVGATEDGVASLPDEAHHLILCLSDSMDFQIVRKVAEKREKSGMYLYLAGNIANHSLDDEKFLRQIPAVHFPSFPLNIDALSRAIELNSSEKKHILVVDDEPILLRSAKMWLQDDFNVSLAPSGETALEFLSTHTVDLVLLDYRMPTMSGPEVLKRIRDNDRTRNLPVIFLTANGKRENIIDVMKFKIEGYILKSQSPEEIKKSVRDFFKMQQKKHEIGTPA